MKPRAKTSGARPEAKSDFRKLGLDVRVVNALAAQGIVSLHDLAHVTERDLASFRGIGPSTRDFLKDYLKKERASEGISLVLPTEYLSAIDEWRLTHQGDAPTRAQAIHKLVEIGLAALKKPATA
jgi:hypothetical protein